MLIAFELHHCVTRTVFDKFQCELKANDWILSKQQFKYPEFGDSIDGSSTFLFGLNAESNATNTHYKSN